MTNNKEVISRNLEAMKILKKHLIKEDATLANASMNELVDLLKARYQSAFEINPARVPEVNNIQFSLTGLADKKLVGRICEDEIMINILKDLMHENLNVNEIMESREW